MQNYDRQLRELQRTSLSARYPGSGQRALIKHLRFIVYNFLSHRWLQKVAKGVCIRSWLSAGRSAAIARWHLDAAQSFFLLVLQAPGTIHAVCCAGYCVTRNCMLMISPSNVLTEARNNACTMLIKMTTPAEAGAAQSNAMIPLPSLRDCSVRVSTAYCSELLSCCCCCSLHPMQAEKCFDQKDFR